MKLENPNLIYSVDRSSYVDDFQLPCAGLQIPIPEPELFGISTLISHELASLLMPTCGYYPIIPGYDSEHLVSGSKMLLFETTFVDSLSNYTGLQRPSTFDSTILPILQMAKAKNIPAVLFSRHDEHSIVEFDHWFSNFDYIYCTDKLSAKYVSQSLGGSNFDGHIKVVGPVIQPFYTLCGRHMGQHEAYLVEAIAELLEHRSEFREIISSIPVDLDIVEGRFDLFASKIRQLPDEYSTRVKGVASEVQFQMCLGQYSSLVQIPTELSSVHRVAEQRILMELSNGKVINGPVWAKASESAETPYILPEIHLDEAYCWLESDSTHINTYRYVLDRIGRDVGRNLRNTHPIWEVAHIFILQKDESFEVHKEIINLLAKHVAAHDLFLAIQSDTGKWKVYSPLGKKNPFEISPKSAPRTVCFLDINEFNPKNLALKSPSYLLDGISALVFSDILSDKDAVDIRPLKNVLERPVAAIAVRLEDARKIYETQDIGNLPQVVLTLQQNNRPSVWSLQTKTK